MHKRDNNVSKRGEESSNVSSAHLDPVLDFIDGMFAVEIGEEAEKQLDGGGVFVCDHGGDVFVFGARSAGGFDNQAF